MNRILSISLCLLILLAPACQSPLLSPEQRQQAIAQTEAQRASGQISEAQAEAIIAALKADAEGTPDWESLLWSLGSIAGAIFGIRVWRGRARGPEENVALRRIAKEGERGQG